MPIKNRSRRMTQRTSIVGVLRDQARAQQAVRELREAGFTEEEIGVLARDESGGTKKRRRGKEKDDTYAGEGALAGVAVGAGIGALWTLGIFTGVLPALGPVIAGGWIAAALASAAGGAAAGGLVGALVGAGIPEDESAWYESEFKEGRTLVVVSAEPARVDEAWAILSRHGAYNRTSSTEQRAALAAGAEDTEGDVKVRGRATPSRGRR